MRLRLLFSFIIVFGPAVLGLGVWIYSKTEPAQSAHTASAALSTPDTSHQ